MPKMRYEIIVDSGETPNKCTITPLSGRSDFRLFPVYGEGPLGPLYSPIFLHPEGECLSTVHKALGIPSGIACIDCVWRRLPVLEKRLAWKKEPALRVRIPEGFKTVYPRVGAKHSDPEGGLATIEAIFIAAALLGNVDTSLLSKYYFARDFLEENRKRFEDFDIINLEALPYPSKTPQERNASTRRWNRGRSPESVFKSATLLR
jgi:pre-rRNA-processing protein TSR3